MSPTNTTAQTASATHTHTRAKLVIAPAWTLVPTTKLQAAYMPTGNTRIASSDISEAGSQKYPTEEGPAVAYVIAEPCIGVKDNSCVEVCPVDCIHPTPDEPEHAEVDQLFIDPEECIDCDACVEACPVDAIFPEDEVPVRWQHFTDLNAAYYRDQAA